jgi:hypothetical protein
VSAAAPGKPVRLGLRAVGGLTQAGAARIVAARNVRAFASVPDLAYRAKLDPRPRSTGPMPMRWRNSRPSPRGRLGRQAGIERMPLLLGSAVRRSAAGAAGADGSQDIVADYRRLDRRCDVIRCVAAPSIARVDGSQPPPRSSAARTPRRTAGTSSASGLIRAASCS